MGTRKPSRDGHHRGHGTEGVSPTMRRKRTAIAERVCAHCGATFTAWNYVVGIGSAVFCSRACHNEGQRVPHVLHICETCGAHFFVPPSRSARTHFCTTLSRPESQRTQRASLAERLKA